MRHFHDALNHIPESEFLHAQGAVGIRHGEVVGIRRRIEDRFVVRPSRVGWVRKRKAITDHALTDGPPRQICIISLLQVSSHFFLQFKDFQQAVRELV